MNDGNFDSNNLQESAEQTNHRECVSIAISCGTWFDRSGKD